MMSTSASTERLGRGPLAARVGWSGLLGSGLILVGCAVAGSLFERNGYRYSIFGCFISELGDVSHSRGHAFFNGALMLAAPAMLYFMLGLGGLIGGRLSVVARAAGAIAAVGAFFVGFYPMNQLAAHLQAADTFFYAGMIAVFLYSFAIVRARGRLPPSLALFGALVALVFAAFLFLPLGFHVGPAPTLFTVAPYQHPGFWLLAFMEWLVLLGVLGWIGTTALVLLRRFR